MPKGKRARKKRARRRPAKGSRPGRSRRLSLPTGHRHWYGTLIDTFAAYDADCVRSSLAIARGLKTGTGAADESPAVKNLTAPRQIKRIMDLARLFPPGGLAQSRCHRMVWALIEDRIDRRLANIEDEISTVQKKSVIQAVGQRLTYDQVFPAVARIGNHDRREAIWEAFLEFVEQGLNPLYADRRRRYVKELERNGLGTPEQYAQTRSGVRMRRLADVCAQVAAETDARYRQEMARLVGQTHDWAFPGVKRCHWERIAGLAAWRHLFPARRIRRLVRQTCAGLGLNFREQPNLKCDLADNPRKDWNAYCMTINPPQEVWLVLKPHGGYEDIRSLLHESGHAWFHALTCPNLPYEDRALPLSDALTETYAFLFENLLTDWRWLNDMLDLDEATAKRLAHDGRLCDQHRFRRYLGKHLYELERCRHPFDCGANRVAYTRLLSQLTGFHYESARYLDDLQDPDFYSSSYLRAWLAVGHLEGFIKRRFGRRWWRNPDAGAWLRRLWDNGVRYELEPLMKETIGVDVHDPTPLLNKFLGQNR